MDAEQRERMGAAGAAKYGKEEWDRMGVWIDGRRRAYDRAADLAAGQAAQADAESEGRLWRGIAAEARDGCLALQAAGAKGRDVEAAMAARMREAKRANRASDARAAADALASAAEAWGPFWERKDSEAWPGWYALAAAEAEGGATAVEMAARIREANRAHRTSRAWAAADIWAAAARYIAGPA